MMLGCRHEEISSYMGASLLSAAIRQSNPYIDQSAWGGGVSDTFSLESDLTAVTCADLD